MLELRDLIIDRIEQGQRFQQQNSNLNISNTNSLQSQFQANRKRLKEFTRTKKNQKDRIVKQRQLLQDIKSLRFWHNRVLQNFFSSSLAILAASDTKYLSLLHNGQNLVQKLQHLFSVFLKHQQQQQSFPFLSQLQRGGIKDVSPAEIMVELCEWSRNLLNSKLHSAMNSEFDRHEQEMKRISLNRSQLLAKEKNQINSLVFSSQVQKIQEIAPLKVVFTNKQSVYGLFIDELVQYYKGLPLQLDVSFLKTMRKSHSKGNEFERVDNVQRAAEILMDAKNKHTKEQILEYRQSYYVKYPHKLRSISEQQKRNQSPTKSIQKSRRLQNMKQQFFERIKSEEKGQQDSKGQLKEKKASNDKMSFLLCPKPTEISFQSSKQIVKQLKRSRLKRQFQLPQLMPHKSNNPHSKSTVAKAKHISSFINSSSSSVANIDSKSKDKGMPKYYEFKHPKALQRMYRKNNFSCTQNTGKQKQKQQNPQRVSRKTDGQQLKRNRKLMLQLLRQKNRYAFLNK